MEERLGGRKKVGRWPLMWVTTSFFFYYYFQLFFSCLTGTPKERENKTQGHAHSSTRKNLGTRERKFQTEKKGKYLNVVVSVFFSFLLEEKKSEFHIYVSHTHRVDNVSYIQHRMKNETKEREMMNTEFSFRIQQRERERERGN